ncbi:UDP-N-acetylmuramoyl-tripeptide--D-alanyl-D-alanine ligase [Fuchsiella alkaliacetigena]|uniref:UDP-N-acetylmuramoyl-tripeptide--D-alanyl-D- alanine ligase n=1 Tax=Fuchsiella alkaliacetigena TaxID=957042 RepID=UPI00200A27F4|nr:UDP-N-acetylmuramoyl-tripeptide--D-alanyl-D-alanine ligase [Fuchsiella alkaliacetigena]MCK8823677.1 UDP-N-acetylmuramoyl-tripeptide--D-alanyl-D-alanine ligase [Fuchsiella alkaliacetigena]
MESIKVKEFIIELNGNLINGNYNDQIQGVSIDSRTVDKEELFFAIPGDNFDGHDFVKEALGAGAKGVVIEAQRAVDYEFLNDELVIGVADTKQALQDLAKYYRSLFEIPIIGVTGSTGKTTTKDLIASVLATELKILKTKGNYNNEFGLPLTLFRLDSSHQAAVVEMAMRGLGEIEQLAEIAQPELGVITNIGLSHLECLGSLENIALAKSELVKALPKHGCAVLNGDDQYLRRMAVQSEAEVFYYGYEVDNELQVKEVQDLGMAGLEFVVEFAKEEFKLELPLSGEYNVYNSLAAIGVALQLGLSMDSIKKGLAKPKLTEMRGDIKELAAGITLINDAYNANPTSMRAGLQLLNSLAKEDGRSIAVLGDMLELGPVAEEAHRQLAEDILARKVDYLFTVGDLAALIAQEAKEIGLAADKVFRCSNNREIVTYLLQLLEANDTILLKGSRGMSLEEVETSLLAKVDQELIPATENYKSVGEGLE